MARDEARTRPRRWLPFRRRTRRAVEALLPERPLPEHPATVPDAPPPPARIIAVTSGKGGTGKSIVSTNLACYLARHHRRVLLFDADFGLANAHLMLGMQPDRTLAHAVRDHAPIEDCVVPGPHGVTLLSGGSGIVEMAALKPTDVYRLAAQLEALQDRFDRIVVDTGAGIAPATLTFLHAASETVVVTTPDVTAITDAYAVIKTVRRSRPDARLGILVNRARSRAEGRDVYHRLERVAARYVGEAPSYLGSLPEHRVVAGSVARRTPFLLDHPRSEPARRFLRMARRLKRLGDTAPTRPTDRILPLLGPD